MSRSDEALWAITSYFDPLGTRNRLRAFREFRRRLQVPLIAAELSFGAAFDLGPDDADILIQLRGESVLWQKERLLNIALRALPADCDAVAWLDCDVIFVNDDWGASARELLDRFALVQPFSRLQYLDRDDLPETCAKGGPADPFDSVAFKRVHGGLPENIFGTPGSSRRLRYAPGMAWVAKRELLEQCGGLYDAAIMGGADKLMFAAACGRWADAARGARMSPRERQYYKAWAQPFHRLVNDRISYVDGDLFHLWHADLANRKYLDRYEDFDRFAFTPGVDIDQTRDGVWRWNSDKPELHAHVRRHFEHTQGAEAETFSRPAHVRST